MAVLPFRDAQSVGPPFVGDRAVVPVGDQNQPVGLLLPSRTDFDRELAIAGLGLTLHRNFDELYAVARVIGDLVDDAGRLAAVLIEVGPGAANHHSQLSDSGFW